VLPIGENIKRLLSQRKSMDFALLSRTAHVGENRLKRIMDADVQPSVAELERIAHALGVRPSMLVESEEEKELERRIDPQLIKLLDDPKLAAALWYLSELPDEDRQAIFGVLQRFADTDESHLDVSEGSR
jgi:transcriptional regulator with XRE-family HTH domain